MAFNWDQYQTDGTDLQLDPTVDRTYYTAQAPMVSDTGAPTSGNTGINGGNTGINGAPTGGVQPAPTTGGQRWDQNYFSQNFGTPRTPQELAALEQKITAAGGKVIRNAAGVAGKIQTPDGRVIDIINSAGAGGNGFQWLEGGGGGGSNLGSLGYNFGASMTPFTAPTAADALNSPGLQFALSEANRMNQNSAAAKGTLLNGRFQQALGAANIQNALQGYGDVYNRAYQTHVRNQDAPFEKNLNLAKLGQPT